MSVATQIFKSGLEKRAENRLVREILVEERVGVVVRLNSLKKKKKTHLNNMLSLSLQVFQMRQEKVLVGLVAKSCLTLITP